MTARAIRVVVGALLVAVVSLPLTAQPAAAAGFTSVTINGSGMSRPVRVADSEPELFDALVGQVAWMAGGRGDSAAPPAEQLGPKYTLTLIKGEKAEYRYELYPLAAGGPRAHRPRKQPGRTSTPAWFYGRLTMSEALNAAGVPLAVRADPLSGGIGGGEYLTDDWVYAPEESVAVVVEEWERLFWINFGILLVITAGLAGVSRLVRPRPKKATVRPATGARGPTAGPPWRPPAQRQAAQPPAWQRPARRDSALRPRPVRR